MGQNTIGLPKGIATALDEIARNVQYGRGAKQKLRTEEDYYNEFLRRKTSVGFRAPKDALRKRLYNRAKERYYKEHPVHNYKLATVKDMVQYLVDHHNKGAESLLWAKIGKNVERHEMAKKAIEIYRTCKELID